MRHLPQSGLHRDGLRGARGVLRISTHNSSHERRSLLGCLCSFRHSALRRVTSAVLTDPWRFHAKTVTPRRLGVRYAPYWSLITTKPRIRCVGNTRKFAVLNVMRSRFSPMSGRIAPIATRTSTFENSAPIARNVTPFSVGKSPSTRSRTTKTDFRYSGPTLQYSATIVTRARQLGNFWVYQRNVCLAICPITRKRTIPRMLPIPQYLALPAIPAIPSTVG